MSSAKTIADILSFSELVDGKSFIGNPFTSQPMYIAACAFLMESAFCSSPSSQSASPSHQSLLANQSSGFFMESSNASDRKPNTKHSLLASAARENYHKCYEALKALENYWEGSKYILTVLDQKAKGIVDPLLYTEEEMEGTADTPSVRTMSGSNWRQSNLSNGPHNSTEESVSGVGSPSDGRRSPRIDPSHGEILSYSVSFVFMNLTFNAAIGWSLTNATNSSQPNISLLYQMPAATADSSPENKPLSAQFSQSYTDVPVQPGVGPSATSYPRSLEHPQTSSTTHDPLVSPSRVATSDANLLLGLNSPYPHPLPRPSNSRSAHEQDVPNSSSSSLNPQMAAYNYASSTANNRHHSSGHMGSRTDFHSGVQPQVNGDVLIESQDIDMSTLHQQDQFPFSFNGLPWLEYLPQDVLSYFGDQQNIPLMTPEEGTHPPPR